MKRTIPLILTLALSSSLLVQCETIEWRNPFSNYHSVWPEKVPDGPIQFKKHVKPLLVYNCLECHNTQYAARNGGLNLESRQLAFSSGRHAPVIVSGAPDKSLLIRVLELDMNHNMAMPPAPDKIWGVRMQILKRWIAEGAMWPEGEVLASPIKQSKT